MTEHGSPYVDGPHPDGSYAQGAGRSGPEPMDPVARVDLQRAQQARYGTEPHPDAALFASRLARVVADSPAGAAERCGRRAAPAARRPAASPGPPVFRRPSAPRGPPPRPRRRGRRHSPPLSPGERDESTVKLTPAGPTRPRPRPSPRPRALGLVTGAGEPPLGIVEGPASATTKAPAAVARALGRAASSATSSNPAVCDPAGPGRRAAA